MLNDPQAEERLAALQVLIDRARRHGIGVYLYFNEPQGVPCDHSFWQEHATLRGVEKWNCFALCTSTAQVQSFFREALESAFAPLRDVEGVILITGNEGLTHCWSKHTTRAGDAPPTCPRCRERAPADVVLDLLRIWAEVSANHPTPFRILAWNWEWSLWYPDPQLPVVAHLPEGMELLLGFEMGGTRRWQGREIFVGEYALSYPGPCAQFLATRAVAAKRSIPVHAKIELNNTHELCSVPNIPVLSTLHTRFAAMTNEAIAGFMGCWTMSGALTLNTFAVHCYLRDPLRYVDEQTFLTELARDYFGCTMTAEVAHAWRCFGDAFTHYPFAIPILYNGPHNDAPARPLSLHFTGKPIGRSWMNDEPGDDLSRLFPADASGPNDFTPDEVIDGYQRLYDGWQDGLAPYAAALEANDVEITEEHQRHRREELGCARMIGLQLRSIINVYRFFREQQRVMRALGLTAPCDIPPNEALRAIMADELANVRHVLPLLAADPRLGYHQDTGSYKYDAAKIRGKIEQLTENLIK